MTISKNCNISLEKFRNVLLYMKIHHLNKGLSLFCTFYTIAFLVGNVLCTLHEMVLQTSFLEFRKDWFFLFGYRSQFPAVDQFLAVVNNFFMKNILLETESSQNGINISAHAFVLMHSVSNYSRKNAVL